MSTKKNFVVYSVLCGGKEDLNANMCPAGSETFDRIIFSDRTDIQAEGWEVRNFDTNDLEPERSSRRPKLMPHQYLGDYEWSLYLDNTVNLKVDPMDILGEYKDTGPSFFSFSHPWRNCIFQEAEEIIRIGYDDERRVREQIDHYKNYGFPEEAGLVAGTMLLRRHNDPGLSAVSEEWYEHVLRFSKRDQMSFNFVAWRRSFKYGVFSGSLTDNSYMSWPAAQGHKRLTASFDEAFYRWINPELNAVDRSAREHYLEARDAGKDPMERPYHWELRQLANKYKTDKGNMYYNAHNYADIYEYLLKNRRADKIKVLELGLLRHDVQARQKESVYDDIPSLAMWREYFPNAEIYGFDVADFSAAQRPPGVIIVQGDMGDEADVNRLLEISGGGFDVIIDDASHASHHQQFALAQLFPHLNAGGVYFIEDLHYQPPQWEVDGITKTVDILKGLEINLLRPTEFIRQQHLFYIRSNTHEIRFFDSGEKVFGVIYPDALCAIFKKHELSGTNARESWSDKAEQWLLKRVTAKTP